MVIQWDDGWMVAQCVALLEVPGFQSREVKWRFLIVHACVWHGVNVLLWRQRLEGGRGWWAGLMCSTNQVKRLCWIIRSWKPAAGLKSEQLYHHLRLRSFNPNCFQTGPNPATEIRLELHRALREFLLRSDSAAEDQIYRHGESFNRFPFK